jgi:hypothetical protein
MGEFAGRTDFWNIGYPFAGALVYLVAPIALASIAYELCRRWRLWHNVTRSAIDHSFTSTSRRNQLLKSTG